MTLYTWPNKLCIDDIEKEGVSNVELIIRKANFSLCET